jgi:hypothetical protein
MQPFFRLALEHADAEPSTTDDGIELRAPPGYDRAEAARSCQIKLPVLQRLLIKGLTFFPASDEEKCH